MMDFYHRRAALGGLGLLLLLSVPCAIIMLAFDDRTRPGSAYPSDSDAAAIDFFHAHRQDFEKMRSLIEGHPFIYLAAESGRDESPPGAFRDVTQTRKELLRLMETLRLQAINGTQSSWGIRLILRSAGMVMAGSNKSFHYSGKTPPKNLVPSTEGFVPNTPDSSGVCRPIESGWYLQFDWGG